MALVKAVRRVNSGFQVFPGCFSRDGAIRAQDKVLRGGGQRFGSGLADFVSCTGRQGTQPFHPAHEGPLEHLRDLHRSKPFFAHFQVAVDHVTGVIQEGVQVSIAAVIIADMQDVERAIGNLSPQGQVGWLDIFLVL